MSSILVFYDWNKIDQQSRNSVPRTLRIISLVLSGITTPDSYTSPDYYILQHSYKGSSFLANSDKLLRFIRSPQSNSFDIPIVQYVYLASLRRYADYMVNKQTTLSLLESPLSMEVIKTNKLLRIEDGIIHFKLEKF